MLFDMSVAIQEKNHSDAKSANADSVIARISDSTKGRAKPVRRRFRPPPFSDVIAKELPAANCEAAVEDVILLFHLESH